MRTSSSSRSKNRMDTSSGFTAILPSTTPSLPGTSSCSGMRIPSESGHVWVSRYELLASRPSATLLQNKLPRADCALGCRWTSGCCNRKVFGLSWRRTSVINGNAWLTPYPLFTDRPSVRQGPFKRFPNFRTSSWKGALSALPKRLIAISSKSPDCFPKDSSCFP